jgi:hypothetical protein
MIAQVGSLVLLFAVLFSVAMHNGFSTAQPSTTEAPLGAAATDWASFVDQFLEAYFVTHPSLAVDTGRHEFDGQVPDWNAVSIHRQIGWLEQSRAKASEFTDQILSGEQRFQRDYLISRIDDDLFWLREARAPFTNPAFYFDNGLDPNTYVTLPYAPTEQRMRAFIKYAQAIPNAVVQIRANLQMPMPRTFVDYAIAGFNGLAEFYRKDGQSRGD